MLFYQLMSSCFADGSQAKHAPSEVTCSRAVYTQIQVELFQGMRERTIFHICVTRHSTWPALQCLEMCHDLPWTGKHSPAGRVLGRIQNSLGTATRTTTTATDKNVAAGKGQGGREEKRHKEHSLRRKLTQVIVIKCN